MHRPTFDQIAAEAGVSRATVERVLNGRGGVRDEKVRRIIAAARALGYDRRLPEAHRSITRIELIIARPETSFFTRLLDAFARISETLDPNIVLHRTVIPQDPEECVVRLRDSRLRRAGLIITAPDHPMVRDALLDLHGTGLPIVQLVTRSAGAAADYVGIDNHAAGRTAAMFIDRMCRRRGLVVALGPSRRYAAHKDRLAGFSAYFAAHPNPDLLFERVILSEEQGAFGVTELRELLDGAAPVAGFYNCGGQNGPLCALIRQHPAAAGLFFVGHEVTAHSRAALHDGTMQIVLDQAPESQARQAVDLMLSRLGLLSRPVGNPLVQFYTFTAETI